MYKALDHWLPAYLRRRPYVRPKGTVDLLIAVCDHFEPLHRADKATALDRIRNWKRAFPKSIQPFADMDGCQPRHTFFYPIEQYDSDIVSELAELCRLSGGETEIHLHHENDTAEALRAKLERGKENLAHHGLLSLDRAGNLRYGFIHGDWALDNSHPRGRHCGVSNELGILMRTGCYADFTMPSAPDPTQTRIINSLYHAQDTPQPKSHDTGVVVAARDRPLSPCPDSRLSAPNTNLLMVQGPLGLNWERRKFGLLPRLENGELSVTNPPTPDRLSVWTRLGIHVQGRPEWLFIKLHTHGGVPENFQMLAGEPMRRFHEFLGETGRVQDGLRFHYVSAREMVNILLAAQDGRSGNPNQFREYQYKLRR